MSSTTALRTLARATLVVALLGRTATAQAENNWHPLQNGFDVIYVGSGSGGGNQTSADGIGVWVPGEDLRGSSVAAFSGDFGYKLVNFRFSACLFNATPGALSAFQPNWQTWEFDGLNANAPAIFTNPVCVASGLLSTAFGAPYGVGPGSSVTMIVAPLPTMLGTASFLFPNNGILPSSAGGTGTLISALGFTSSVQLATGCYAINIGFTPTFVAGLDDIDGWWHWHQTGAIFGTARNYWGYSTDEINLWQSRTFESFGNLAGVFAAACTSDYAFDQFSFEANTTAALSPVGAELIGGNDFAAAGGPGGVIGAQVNGGLGAFAGMPYAVLSPNDGYDLGSDAISLSGLTGYSDINEGLGTAVQDPSNFVAGAGLSTLGFVTHDTRAYGGIVPAPGSTRLLWCSFDWGAYWGTNPDTHGDFTRFFGTVRVPHPIYADGPLGLGVPAVFPDPTCNPTLLFLFSHLTSPSSSLPTLPGGTFGVSVSLPTSSLGLCTTSSGLPLVLSFGTSGMGTWNPAVASTSGLKQLHLLD